MLQDLLCLIRYGKTRFGLLEHYKISVMRVDLSEYDSSPRSGCDEWSACSDVMVFDYGHNGVWVTGKTPFEAMMLCIAKINSARRNGIYRVAPTLSGLQTVDGISLSAGDRVLVKDQADAE